ncbi:MAG: amidase family protein, partial [Limosilactobacillus oris]
AVPAFADQLPASNQPTTSQTAQAAASQSRQQGNVDQPQTTNPAETGRFANQSAGALAQQVRDGKINDQGLINDTYRQIDQQNHQLNNVIYTNPADANQQLQDLQKAGHNEQPFYGVPLLIKGIGQPYKGYPNTNGLPYEQDVQSHYTKNFVQRLKDLGFIILGQTNYPELGLINVTNSNLYGPAHNPWSLDRNPGGSSGGAAASVAAGIVPIATGNDAGGSLRIPASWSGVIGLKPTQGLIIGDSTTPSVVNFAETRDINDTVTLLKGLLNPKQAGTLKALPQDLRSLKIAYSLVSPVGTPVCQDARAAVLNAVQFLRAQGFNVVEQDSSVDGVKLMQNYYLGALSDGSVANFLFQQKYHRNLTAEDVKAGLVSPMTYALYEASRKAPKNVRQQYQDGLATVHQQMAAFHQQYPIYLTPTTATTAPLNSDPAFLPADVAKLLQIKDLNFKDQMNLIYAAWLHGLSKTPFTQLANVAGEPALSLPTYVSAAGLPLGIQLEGAPGSDLVLLALGKLFEDHHQFHFLNDYRAQVLPPKQAATPQAIAPTKKAGATGGQLTNNHMVTGSQLTSTGSNKTREVSALQPELPQTGSQHSTILVVLGISSLLVLLAVDTEGRHKQR